MRNWLAIRKPTCCAPVAASPESCVERIAEIGAGEIEDGTKFAGNAPPLLKKLLSASATFCWFWLSRRALPENGGEVQQDFGRGIAQVGREAAGGG